MPGTSEREEDAVVDGGDGASPQQPAAVVVVVVVVVADVADSRVWGLEGDGCGVDSGRTPWATRKARAVSEGQSETSVGLGSSTSSANDILCKKRGAG